MLETILPDSDYVVDGRLSVESITGLIIKEIDNRKVN